MAVVLKMYAILYSLVLIYNYYDGFNSKSYTIALK